MVAPCSLAAHTRPGSPAQRAGELLGQAARVFVKAVI